MVWLPMKTELYQENPNHASDPSHAGQMHGWLPSQQSCHVQNCLSLSTRVVWKVSSIPFFSAAVLRLQFSSSAVVSVNRTKCYHWESAVGQYHLQCLFIMAALIENPVDSEIRSVIHFLNEKNVNPTDKPAWCMEKMQ